jgi:hypothetical protein
MNCYTSSPEKYTNIAEGGDADAALWKALTSEGDLAGAERPRYALSMRPASVHSKSADITAAAL